VYLPPAMPEDYRELLRAMANAHLTALAA
jgi:hypothetical protein